MKIIVTGGTGLIGSQLVKKFADNNHEVIILTRNAQAGGSQPAGVKLVGWDARTISAWAEQVDGADAIVNLAGESIAGDTLLALITRRWTPERKKLIQQSRQDAGNAITEAVRLAKHKPGVLIQASAVGYYGSRGDEVLTEDTRPGNDFGAQVCQVWEASTADVEGMGVRRAVIRSAGVVMSTQGGAFPFMLLPFKLFAGGPLGNGHQWFSWIHMEDEVNAINFLIENPAANGPFNLAAPQTITNGEFSKILGRVMHRPALLPTPGFLLRLAVGEKADILLGSQKQVPQKLQQLGYQFKFPQAELAIRDQLGK